MYARRHDAWAWVRAYGRRPAERRAAHAELRAERAIRRERDNPDTAERRAAAMEAEARRYCWYVRPR
jgi:hypothetical protein